ncbi:Guanylate kinase [Gloeothece citriformis PCC 7424]|uniref:Guanylate kinase n=1 Tax=Gloeothece citriformis (strain PCC 7424) TaxID=65393 RepID=B7KFA5_GLOC7|nr:guanylate kinase [Gloeothece citriformis]ACK71821.1 Guanylate kinase [Gloeothece citriformis PCC 7424]
MRTLKNLGRLIVITGPSGVGKGTLVRLLLTRHPEWYLSVSATTRDPRRGEIDGKDYYFLTKTQFESMIEGGDFLEWAEYAGNYYGTPRTQVEEHLNQGHSVVLEIEVLGARQIKETFPDALRIFILPPSMTELENRLRKRAKDSQAVIELRLKRAEEEIATSQEFDWQIVNEHLETALEDIESIILSTVDYQNH